MPTNSHDEIISRKSTGSATSLAMFFMSRAVTVALLVLMSESQHSSEHSTCFICRCSLMARGTVRSVSDDGVEVREGMGSATDVAVDNGPWAF